MAWGDPARWYLSSGPGDPLTFGFIDWFTMSLRFFLLEYQFVPVSLYVSMNAVYIGCRFFLLQERRVHSKYIVRI